MQAHSKLGYIDVCYIMAASVSLVYNYFIIYLHLFKNFKEGEFAQPVWPSG